MYKHRTVCTFSSCFPAWHVLKQLRKHFLRLSGCHQSLSLALSPLPRARQLLLLPSYNSPASLPSCISGRNAVYNGVPSYFEDVPYNHTALVQNGGTPDSYSIQAKQAAQGCSPRVGQEPCKAWGRILSRLCRQARGYLQLGL